MSNSIILSALDLAVVAEGSNAGEAIKKTGEVARHIENLDFKRIWLAEHHNMEHIASSATAVLIGYVASLTTHIRVGSGGIMLPNHAPLAIAEQFGTLETLYPGRIDLGLGRAPGTDQATAMVLRRNNFNTAYNFPSDVRELQHYFSDDNVSSRVRAFPGEGLDIPIWILGSSTDSAHLAAQFGLPYAFAAHFAPAQFRAAIQIYRQNFRPSEHLREPYVMACVNVIGADTDEEAQFLSTSLYRMFLGVLTNQRSALQPPVPSMEPYWNPEIRQAVAQMLACTFVGSEDTLRQKLGIFIAETGINELMVTSNLYDQQAKLHSYSLLKSALTS